MGSEWRPEGWQRTRFDILHEHYTKRTTDGDLVDQIERALLAALREGGRDIWLRGDWEGYEPIGFIPCTNCPRLWLPKDQPGHLVWIPEEWR